MYTMNWAKNFWRGIVPTELCFDRDKKTCLVGPEAFICGPASVEFVTCLTGLVLRLVDPVGHSAKLIVVPADLHSTYRAGLHVQPTRGMPPCRASATANSYEGRSN